jgi:hypothetical protein
VRASLSVLLCACSTLAAAQSSPVDVRGYLKDLAGWVDDPAIALGPEQGNFQNTLQNRLEFRFYGGNTLTAGADLRTLLTIQRNLNPGGTFTAQLDQNDYLFDLSAVLAEGSDAVLYAEIDRAYLEYFQGSFQATAGRQRIAWGTALVWNPTDVFNPYSILQFDYEERPGTDALRLQYYTGPTSKVEAVVAPGPTSRQRRAAGLFHFNMLEYDFNFLAGVLQGGYFLGGSWAGRIGAGGFRGEARWTSGQEVNVVVGGNDSTLTYLTGSLSGDYTFPNSLYLHAELLYNGDGVTENAGLRWSTAISRLQLSPARWSLYGEVAGDFSPLLRGSLYGIVNPLDGSFIVVPSLAWSVSTNWDLLLIGLFPAGETLSEYGAFGSGAFVSLKWSF